MPWIDKISGALFHVEYHSAPPPSDAYNETLYSDAKMAGLWNGMSITLASIHNSVVLHIIWILLAVDP